MVFKSHYMMLLNNYVWIFLRLPAVKLFHNKVLVQVSLKYHDLELPGKMQIYIYIYIYICIYILLFQTFYVVSAIIKMVKKKMKDVGFSDILIESGLITADSIVSVLPRKRLFECHKIQ